MEEIVSRFAVEGTPISCEAHGSGHINRTYRVRTDAGKTYTLQCINHHVFRDVEGLMGNVAGVTDWLRRKDPQPRHSLRLIPTLDGRTYTGDEETGYWRMYEFVQDSLCLDAPQCLEDFRQSALAFGQFQHLLADYPADTLTETIPHFHDTPDRFRQLREAIREDRAGRAASARKEIDFALAREAEAGRNVRLQEEGLLPLRVTHNDTKLNNVLLDSVTRQPLCVIDLDTVMPGLVCNDFGDSIRFGASTAAEDEQDVSLVSLSMERYAAYTDGFLEACGSRLTEEEIRSLPWGARLMTLEVGIRFLADYLNGDVYFHTNYPEHNLVRARTQLALVEDMERKWNDMTAIVARRAGLA